MGAAAKELIDESRSMLTRFSGFERDSYSDIYLIGGRRILFYSDKLKLIDGEICDW